MKVRFMQIESRLKFSEYLKKLSPAQVFELLATDKSTKPTILSTNRLNSMAKENMQEERVLERFELLGDDAKQALLAIYLSGDCGIDVDFSESIRVELLNSLFVYSIRDDSGYELLLGFLDCDTIMHDLIIDNMKLFFASEDSVEANSFYQYRVVSDLLLILHLAGKGALKLKKDGDFMQATIDALTVQLHIGVDTTLFVPPAKAIRYGAKFLISFAESIGILYLDKQVYRPVLDTIDSWVTKSPDTLFTDMQTFLKTYVGNWNLDILKKIIDDDSIVINTTSSFAFAGERSVSGLQLLHYLGIFGATNIDDTVFWGVDCKRWESEDLAGTVIIMPDFSVLVSQMASPEILNQFLLVGDVIGLDGVYKGSLNRDAIFNSLSSGVNESRIYNFLERWSAPSNIITTVKEWAREFNRVSMIDGSAVVVGDNSTSQALLQHPELMDLVEKIEVETLFSVKKGNEKRVASMLLELGFDIRVRGEDVTEKDSLTLNEILNSSPSKKEFTVTTEFAKKETVVENYGGGGKYSGVMKSLDLNDLHHVIEYAKLMDLPIKFEYSGTEDIDKGVYQVIPLKIVNTDKGYVDGKSEDGNLRKLFVIDSIEKIAVIE